MGDCHNGAGGESRRCFWAEEGTELRKRCTAGWQTEGAGVQGRVPAGRERSQGPGVCSKSWTLRQALEAPGALGGNGRTRLAC